MLLKSALSTHKVLSLLLFSLSLSLLASCSGEVFDSLIRRQVRFASESQSVSEDAGSVTVKILLDLPATEEIRVPLVYKGTAIWGPDYDATLTEVVFPEGSSSATVQINLIDDNIFEPDGNKMLMSDFSQMIINLLSLCIFPFAARPVITGILFNGDDEAFIKAMNERKEVLPGMFKKLVSQNQ